MSEPEEHESLEREPTRRLPAIPSGSLRLDIALEDGGISCGQFVEISGSESSGKTTLCQHIIAEAQKLGRLCAWIDADHTFNPGYARQCGVMLERLYYTSPAYAEQALEYMEVLSGTDAGSVVVLDSVDALTPRGDFDLPLGMATLSDSGAQDTSDKLLSLALRRLSLAVQKNQATILFTHRAQIQSSEAYHQLSTHLARLALKLHAGLRLRLEQVGLIQQNGHIIGQKLQVKILNMKNIASPHTVEFDIIYDQGINHSGEVFDLGLQLGLIRQQGEVYTFQSLGLGAERGRAIDTLESHALIGPMEQVIRQKLLRKSFLAET